MNFSCIQILNFCSIGCGALPNWRPDAFESRRRSAGMPAPPVLSLVSLCWAGSVSPPPHPPTSRFRLCLIVVRFRPVFFNLFFLSQRFYNMILSSLIVDSCVRTHSAHVSIRRKACIPGGIKGKTGFCFFVSFNAQVAPQRNLIFLETNSVK